MPLHEKVAALLRSIADLIETETAERAENRKRESSHVMYTSEEKTYV